MRLVRYTLYLSLVWGILLWLPAQGQESETKAEKKAKAEKERWGKENPLFTSEEVLQFKLVANYEKLLKDRGEERGYHPGTLSYLDPSGDTVTLEVKVMVRGNRRRDPSVCRFPPIMLNFIRKKMPAGTIFADANKVKLVTHCINEDLVLREYLVYKVYNVITDYSFRVRLCQVDYVDSAGERRAERRYAFMIEDDKDMAARNKGKLLPKEVFVRMDKADDRAMAQLAIFQYMIGNSDWSVPFRHNIDILQTDSVERPIPIPFDFDYSGIVGAPYATPPPELGLKTVRARLFRGYSFPENIYREVINTFNAYRTPIYAVYRSCDPLDRGTLKKTLKYLDSFYKTINNPKRFENEIVRVGEKNKRTYVTVKGLQ